MRPKTDEKNIAIKLRRHGLSYSEIAAKVPVSKASLSLWLKNVRLTTEQHQKLSHKSDEGRIKGAAIRREQRLRTTQDIMNRSEQEIGSITRRELWLIGAALYWAEGSKAKAHNVSCGVMFSNSDPLMIKLFLKWLHNICNEQLSQIECELYIHANHRRRVDEIKKYWSNITGFPVNRFNYVYFKKPKNNTLRKNHANEYFGLARIKVRRSTNLNRRISGWVRGINKYFGTHHENQQVDIY